MQTLVGPVEPAEEVSPDVHIGDGALSREGWLPLAAEADDPFDDFEEDDFDDDFDDDFEEDWEDDLTEDDEFPDTFGGGDDDAEEADGNSPFSDDPDFDED